MVIAGSNYNQESWYKKDMNLSCYSCKQSDKTCAHALHCPETNDSVEDWLRRVDTDLDLDYCLTEYT